MANVWNVERLLAHVQRLVGEPEGAFYNIQSRLDDFNRTQEEIVVETRAITKYATLTTTDDNREVDLPTDFLMFAQTGLRYHDGSENYYPVEVVSAADIDDLYPQWKFSDQYGTGSYGAGSYGDLNYNQEIPEHAWVTNQDTLNLLPLPGGGDIEFEYVAAPTQLTDLDDEPFNGITALNRFSVALAFKAANIEMLPINPQYATVLNNMYIQEVKKLRDVLRRNPQTDNRIKPVKARRDSGLADAIHDWRNN